MKAKLRTIIRAARAGVSGTGQVGNVYSPPVWSVSTPTSVSWPAKVPLSYNFGQYASSPVGRMLTFSATGLPPGLSISSITGLVSGTPQSATINSYSPVIRAADEVSYTDIAISVLVPTPAFWTDGLSDTIPATAGFAFSQTFEVTDPDGDPITFVYDPLPVGSPLTITEHAQVGNTRQLTISSDGTGLIAGDTYTIVVDLPDSTVVPTLTLTSNQYFAVSVAWTAVDGALSYSVERFASGAWSVIGSPTAAAWSDLTVSASTAYQYRVRALLASGYAAYSNTLAVTTPAQPAAGSALDDWNARAGGAGVIWAHRFNSPTAEGLYWGQRSNNAAPRRVGYLSATATQSGSSGVRSEAGIIGDGCMEIYVPAGTLVTGGWARPLGPVKAATPSGGFLPYGNDPAANDTIQRLGFNDAYSVIPGDPGGKFGNCAGGFITHPDYLATMQRSFTLSGTPGGTTYNEIAYAGPNGFFIQYRVKFKTLPNGDNRLDYTGLYGKLTMLGNMDPNNANSEIVCNIMPQMGNQFYMYGARGYNTLGSPQNVTSSGSKAQPGGAYDATCLYTGGSPNYPNPAACWCWPKDEWVTVLLQIIPGHHNDQTDWATNGAVKDTGIRVWVAREGATSYTKIWDKTDYAMNYGYFYPWETTRSITPYASGGGNSLQGTQQAYGYNSFRFEMYANPGSADPVAYTKDVWVLIDQVICSTATIPCPVY